MCNWEALLLIGPLMYWLEESYEVEGEAEDGDFKGDDVNCITGSCFGIWHAMISALYGRLRLIRLIVSP